MHRSMGWILILLVVVGFGCRVLPEQSPISESSMDAALSVPEIPAGAPMTDPGEPQKEFEQEVTVESVNL